MNQRKKKLIKELRNGGRKKLTEISSLTNIPVSTLFDMIHGLKREGIVEHKALINFSKLGYNVQLLMVLKTTMERRFSLQQYLQSHRNVNSVFNINSGYDFMVESVFRNQKDAQDFIEKLEENNKILEKKTFNVIDVVHREKFLTEEEHFE